MNLRHPTGDLLSDLSTWDQSGRYNAYRDILMQTSLLEHYNTYRDILTQYSTNWTLSSPTDALKGVISRLKMSLTFVVHSNMFIKNRQYDWDISNVHPFENYWGMNPFVSMLSYSTYRARKLPYIPTSDSRAKAQCHHTRVFWQCSWKSILKGRSKTLILQRPHTPWHTHVPWDSSLRHKTQGW